MFLGVDTSCYTTSVAVVDRNELLLYNKKKPVPVSKGERGLSQSEALFIHLQNLPEILEELGQFFSYSEILSICVSNKPRGLEKSYMPVFKVGEKIAEVMATALQIPCIKTNHQYNHIRAGIWSSKIPVGKFLALHVSGGTTELLKVNWSGKNFIECSLLGGTKDLNAGQFIDRIGVKMGLPFPCGPHIEMLAKKNDIDITIPSYVRDYDISFSGPDAAAIRLLEGNTSPANVARAIESNIAKTLEKLLLRALSNEQISNILMVGGVCANSFIKERLKKRLEHKAVGAKLYFAESQYSSDSAVGTALIGKDLFCDKICK